MADDRCENCDRVKGRGKEGCAVSLAREDANAATAVLMRYVKAGLTDADVTHADRIMTGMAFERSAHAERDCKARRIDWRSETLRLRAQLATLRRVLVDEHGMLRAEFDEIVAGSEVKS